MSTNKKKNAFQMYLYERNDDMKKIDPNFSLKSNEEFIKECREEWKSMSETERHRYGDECLKSKQILNDDQQKSKYKMRDHLYQDNNETRLKEELQQKLIDFMVKNKSNDEIMSQKLYFMSTNIVCIVENTYPPLEIGFVEYSIEKGITKTYHRFIDVGELPIGYSYRAQDHMNTHKIPINNFILASNDYCLIVEEIQQIIADSRLNNQLSPELNPMIVFSNEEQIEQNIGALKWLFDKYKKQINKNTVSNEWDIKVLNVTNLVFEIFLEMGISRPMAICRSDVTSCAFDYCPDTDCPYHQNLECIECAIGVTKRLAYIMSSTMRFAFKIQITANHLPKVNYRPKQFKHFPQVLNHLNPNQTDEEVIAVKSQQFGKGKGRGITFQSK